MSGIDYERYEDEWADEPPPRRTRGRNLSVEAKEKIAAHDAGRVVAVDKGWVTVLFEGEVLDGRYGGAMRGEKVVVGDRVRVRPPRRDTDVARILDVLERESVLTRTPDDDLDEERVVAANVDQVVVVLAADHLESGAGFLDRVIVAAGIGGIATAACVNKHDLVEDGAAAAAVEELADRYEAIGVPIVRTSALTGAGLEDLRSLLADSWTVLAGHSGVGKSSLFNRLIPDADREIGEMGRYGGRHTTVSSRARRVPGIDAWLIDTPGVRSFGIGALEPRDLPRLFPELAALPCDLDDCLHDGEPGCALDQADIHPARLESYRRLLAGLRGADG